mgnify:CR=1 FL=1
MDRGKEIYLKRKEQLDIDGERVAKQERQNRLTDERVLINQRVRNAKNPPKPVLDIFKGKDSDEEAEAELAKEKVTKKRRSTRKTSSSSDKGE